MNLMPIDWSEKLQSVYPKRSGPCGWRGMRLMLALRRALMESTWEEILDGCKNYAKFCEEGGQTGTTFVQAPLRFIEDGSYLETFAYRAAHSKDELARSELRERDRIRMQKAIEAGARFVPALVPDHGECAAAFETRVMLATTTGPRRRQLTDTNGGDAGHAAGSGRLQSDGIEFSSRGGESVCGRISVLANRMRIAK